MCQSSICHFWTTAIFSINKTFRNKLLTLKSGEKYFVKKGMPWSFRSNHRGRYLWSWGFYSINKSRLCFKSIHQLMKVQREALQAYTFLQTFVQMIYSHICELQDTRESIIQERALIWFDYRSKFNEMDFKQVSFWRPSPKYFSPACVIWSVLLNWLFEWTNWIYWLFKHERKFL